MTTDTVKQAIVDGRTALGIEFGSTRIKAVLVDDTHAPVAAGGFGWENQLVDGVWTYALDAVQDGMRAAFRALAGDVEARYGVALEKIGALGVSAMMHGYLPFDADGALLTPFRTWRNTSTGDAARALTEKFGFNIPQRWSVAHLYQAMLNREPHVPHIATLTTLAGYVHTQLTGRRVLGVGDASGMFPVDPATADYDADMLAAFAPLAAEAGLKRTLREILPPCLPAGADAGALTEAGARRLDPSGRLQAGAVCAPPEGDAGTGMVATNAVAPRTGNVSAGTSIFAMVVLEKPLAAVHPEIDLVATPAGAAVAMVHVNNGGSDLDAWVRLLREAAGALGGQADDDAAYAAFYRRALEGDADGGGLLAYNYLSGEHNVGLKEGRPLFARTPDARFTLANFMRTLLFSAMGTLKLGMDLLAEREGVRVDRLLGHGGLFKVPGVMPRLMASALGTPVAVMASAGEGGAWGIALLAAFRAWRTDGAALDAYLDEKVFAGAAGEHADPDPRDAAGFAAFMTRFAAGLAIERAAVECLR